MQKTLNINLTDSQTLLTPPNTLPPIVTPRNGYDHDNIENHNMNKSSSIAKKHSAVDSHNFSMNSTFASPFSSGKNDRKNKDYQKINAQSHSTSRKKNLNLYEENNKKRYFEGDDNDNGSEMSFIDSETYGGMDMLSTTMNSDNEEEDLHYFNNNDVTPMKTRNTKIVKKTLSVQYISDFTVVDAPAAAFDVSLLSLICSSILYNFQGHGPSDISNIHVDAKTQMERLYLSEKILLTSLSFREVADSRRQIIESNKGGPPKIRWIHKSPLNNFDSDNGYDLHSMSTIKSCVENDSDGDSLRLKNIKSFKRIEAKTKVPGGTRDRGSKGVGTGKGEGVHATSALYLKSIDDTEREKVVILILL